MESSIGESLREAAARLSGLPQAEPRLEAQLLLMDASGITREQMIAWPERTLSADIVGRFRALLERRLAGEPIAYIRGHQAFWTLDLAVTPDTLIPRPETELLVETALELLPSRAPLLVADAGTGTGAIAAALACERPDWTLIAIERATGAARVAADNLSRCTARNARVVIGNWLAAIAPGSLDALISNPPYVPDCDPHLRRGDLRFEPRSALASGPRGLDAIHRLTGQAAGRLRSGGLFALEHGFDQAEAIRAILRSRGFRDLETREDLAGHPRVSHGIR